MVKVYLARAMSGRDMAEVVEEARKQRFELEYFGKLICLDPVKEEGVRAVNRPLQSSLKAMKKHWPRDKAMIREAHVFIDCTPHLKSQGVEREAGYARYSLWKPVVRVFPNGQKPNIANVAYFEDDAIVDSFEDAWVLINEKWGTRAKRFSWRFALLKRCLFRWVIFQLGEWK